MKLILLLLPLRPVKLPERYPVLSLCLYCSQNFNQQEQLIQTNKTTGTIVQTLI